MGFNRKVKIFPKRTQRGSATSNKLYFVYDEAIIVQQRKVVGLH